MEKKVFIRTVEDKCIGKIILPNFIYLTIDNGELGIEYADPHVTTYINEDKILDSIHKILSNKVKGNLRYEYKPRDVYTKHCIFYSKKIEETEISDTLNGMAKLIDIFEG